MTVRVVVADDDERFRGALVELLDADDRFEVVGTTGDGEELLGLHERLRPELVLLDVRMPAGGAVAARALTTRPSPPLVVVVSAETAPPVVLEMLRAGAVAYLAKGRLGADLGEFLDRVVSGEVLIGTPTAARVLQQLVAPPA